VFGYGLATPLLLLWVRFFCARWLSERGTALAGVYSTKRMYRCAKLFAPEDLARLRSGYERVLRLTDLTVSCRPRRALLRELLRSRDLVAALYVADAPAPAAHRAAFEVLLRFTPAAAAQIPHVIGQVA